ncbi:hypothetical protein MUJ63_12485 [Lachnospiraceae bacterium NSJ-143]|nr:hypothetical protein [Lachnospiraceae bacterium NSJ-143]
MSKKISEFDRYERMKKLEKEAEAEKRKSGFEGGKRPKKNRPAMQGKCRIKDFDDYADYI